MTRMVRFTLLLVRYISDHASALEPRRAPENGAELLRQDQGTILIREYPSTFSISRLRAKRDGRCGEAALMT